MALFVSSSCCGAGFGLDNVQKSYTNSSITTDRVSHAEHDKGEGLDEARHKPAALQID